MRTRRQVRGAAGRVGLGRRRRLPRSRSARASSPPSATAPASRGRFQGNGVGDPAPHQLKTAVQS